MFKVIATDVVISKGYDGAPALKFSENGESVRFRIGKKVYDTRAENNTRWVNLSVKAFGPVCERIKKMQLKESSFINILGRLDEDVWEDEETKEKRGITSETNRPVISFLNPENTQSLPPTERCPVISPALNPSAA